MQVRGFGQLFVISHDDTFERAAQNYIRIVKDEAGEFIGLITKIDLLNYLRRRLS